MLEIREADQYYDDLQVLHGVSLTVTQGEIVALVGPNAAGKSTTLNMPVLKERQGQMAGFLSGGEPQMLAIGRGLMARPKLLMLDEPSLGLAPMLVQKCFEIVKEVHAQGTTVLLVEQNVHHALTLSDRGYVLENGRIVMSGKGSDLLADPNLRRAYLGA